MCNCVRLCYGDLRVGHYKQVLNRLGFFALRACSRGYIQYARQYRREKNDGHPGSRKSQVRLVFFLSPCIQFFLRARSEAGRRGVAPYWRSIKAHRIYLLVVMFVAGRVVNLLPRAPVDLRCLIVIFGVRRLSVTAPFARG